MLDRTKEESDGDAGIHWAVCVEFPAYVPAVVAESRTRRSRSRGGGDGTHRGHRLHPCFQENTQSEGAVRALPSLLGVVRFNSEREKIRSLPSWNDYAVHRNTTLLFLQ